MQSDPKLIASKIKSLRIAKNITQSDLDMAAELPRSSISKIELGKREATASELVKIALALGVNGDTLLSSEDVFVYREEIKIIEALREISFESYQRIIKTLEAEVYFTAKDVATNQKQYLQDIVAALMHLSKSDKRPRGRFLETKRARRIN